MTRPKRNSIKIAAPHDRYVEDLINKMKETVGIPVVEITNNGSASYLGAVANRSKNHLILSRRNKRMGDSETLLMLTGNMRIVEKCRNGTWFEIV